MGYSLSLPNSSEPVEFITLGELAKKCGKKKDTLIKLINRNILPDANFRTGGITIKKGDRAGEVMLGHRLYSRDYLTPKLVRYIKKNIKRGSLITIEQESELATLFEDERKHFLGN